MKYRKLASGFVAAAMAVSLPGSISVTLSPTKSPIIFFSSG